VRWQRPLFSGWIYNTQQPYAQQLDIAHPAMMKAIGAAKKKRGQIDGRKIAGLRRLLRLSRAALTMFQSVQRQLLRKLEEEAALHDCVQRLESIRGVRTVPAWPAVCGWRRCWSITGSRLYAVAAMEGCELVRSGAESIFAHSPPAVPANGCPVTLRRWPWKRIEGSTPQ
jgi:hypothetical protein